MHGADGADHTSAHMLPFFSRLAPATASVTPDFMGLACNLIGGNLVQSLLACPGWLCVLMWFVRDSSHDFLCPCYLQVNGSIMSVTTASGYHEFINPAVDQSVAACALLGCRCTASMMSACASTAQSMCGATALTSLTTSGGMMHDRKTYMRTSMFSMCFPKAYKNLAPAYTTSSNFKQ
jgi:hypothetical protein